MASSLLMLEVAYLTYENILAISHYMLCKYPCSCNSEHCDFMKLICDGSCCSKPLQLLYIPVLLLININKYIAYLVSFESR